MAIQYADRMEYLKASDIRELLKLAECPDMISFGGGMPAPELFPVDELKKVVAQVLEESGCQALQYAPTEGHAPLRTKIAERMNRKGLKLTADNVLITNGSQQGLDITGKVFINDGDVILCESPTYLGAINAFRAYRPRMVEVETDDDGMVPEDLEKKLSDNRVRLIYVVPDFQNPSGRCWSLERRKRFMEIASRYEVPVVEDSPYTELRFEGESIPPMKTFDHKGLVIYLGTFSKVFCPGMRIGWVAAEEGILSRYILVKQGTDLHTSEMSQRIISKYLDNYDLDSDIDEIRKVYRKRRDAMLKAISEEFPKNIRYTNPMGGLFTWVELPGNVDSRKLLEECLQNGVAFVPGGSFFPNGEGENTMRMNYSYMPEDKIIEGVRRLGSIIRKYVN